jgi:nicotinamidase-related amidase
MVRVARKRALVIVDVQPAFVRRGGAVVENIATLLRTAVYDVYVAVVFHAERGSLWDVQTGWVCPADERTITVPAILSLLPASTIHVTKTTKSAFKGNIDLARLLRNRGIREVHIVGLDTNDCVLATAYEAFDLGFFTYVIEDCCASSSSDALHRQALALLRHVSLTRKRP